MNTKIKTGYMESAFLDKIEFIKKEEGHLIRTYFIKDKMLWVVAEDKHFTDYISAYYYREQDNSVTLVNKVFLDNLPTMCDEIQAYRNSLPEFHR